jgi:hypothetical protein
VTYSLQPWLARIESAISRSLLTPEEKKIYYARFNVDGLLRGNYESRMQGYATGISNGFLCVNDVRRLENMDLVPDEEGGNLFLVNGSMTPLRRQARPTRLLVVSDPPEQDEPDEEPEKKQRIQSRSRRYKKKAPKKGKEEHMNKFWKWVRNKAPDGEDPDLAARTLFLKRNHRFGELV